MSEQSHRSRRRRRPRSSAKNKSSEAKKTPSGENKPSSSGGRRGRSRRRSSNAAKKAKPKAEQKSLTIQQHTEKAISPINKDIFIYTYTLRPRSLLDGYEVGPNIAERMEFEQPDKQPLSD